MIQRYYQAEYVDKTGKVLASYSFQADTNAKALIEARGYKRTSGCEICLQCNLKLTVTGKKFLEPEPKRKRGRPKRGINKFNH